MEAHGGRLREALCERAEPRTPVRADPCRSADRDRRSASESFGASAAARSNSRRAESGRPRRCRRHREQDVADLPFSARRRRNPYCSGGLSRSSGAGEANDGTNAGKPGTGSSGWRKSSARTAYVESGSAAAARRHERCASRWPCQNCPRPRASCAAPLSGWSRPRFCSSRSRPARLRARPPPAPPGRSARTSSSPAGGCARTAQWLGGARAPRIGAHSEVEHERRNAARRRRHGGGSSVRVSAVAAMVTPAAAVAAAATRRLTRAGTHRGDDTRHAKLLLR